MSVISDESEAFYKDPLTAYTCSPAASQFLENDFSEMEDMKVYHCLSFHRQIACNNISITIIVCVCV